MCKVRPRQYACKHYFHEIVNGGCIKFRTDIEKFCSDNEGLSTKKYLRCEVQRCSGPTGQPLKLVHGDTKGKEGRRLVDLKNVKNPRVDLDSNKVIGWWPPEEKDYPHVIGGHCTNPEVLPEIAPPATTQCADCKKKDWFGFLN